MMIVSWTLVGPDRWDEVTSALDSARDVVDGHVLIDTDPASRHVIHWPGNIVGFHHWQWRDDYSAARNFALDAVDAEDFCDFSCMLDSDEQIVCPDPVRFRSWMAALPEEVQVILVSDEGATHTRERFFRPKSGLRFRGRAHESLPLHHPSMARIVPHELIRWSETRKTKEQLQAKWRRDELLLQQDIEEDPTNSGAWFYLGLTLQYQGKWQQAIDAFRECVDLNPWESGAWACFRAGECYLELGEPNRAIDAALAGMARDAGIAELPWLAAIASCHEGRYDQARAWAQLAKVHAKGSTAELRRCGFRNLYGLTNGPDDVLKFCDEQQ